MHCFYIRSLFLVPIVLGVGCTQDIAYRHPPAPAAWEDCPTACKGTSSVEFRTYTIEDKDGMQGGSITGNYIIGYVEFDDQGWFHDLSQRTALFRAMQNYRQDKPDTQFLIVVYAHGWKHNSRDPDPDIGKFRKLLERLDATEQLIAADATLHTKARKVVGVYLGWRGSSVPIPYIENVTFWTRKNAGERVGTRSAKQLLVELNELRASLNCWDYSNKLATRNETQLILIGHSFGGLLMYHALHTELMERALQLRKPRGEDGYRYAMAKSFGDFILLVNPAFEGTAYEPLFRAATTRGYTKGQRPVMMIVTSQSDWATKYAFPAGRLYTYTQSAPQDGERDTVLYTVGHLPRYITHTLEPEKRTGRADQKQTGLAPTPAEQQKGIGSENLGRLKEMEEPGYTSYAGVKVVSTRQDLPKFFPYPVMSADRDIINGHNDIWNDRFRDFMVSFIGREIIMDDQKPEKQRVKRDECIPFWFDTAAR